MATETVRAIRRFGIDIGLWYCIPAAFLATYVISYGQPAAAIAPHALLVALPLAALISVRLVLQRLVVHVRLRRLLVAALTAILLAFLITYYGLVLAGLLSWGGVVSWQVIPTFFAQTTVLADALGVPLFLIPLAAAILFAAMAFTCWIYLARFDWAPAFAARLSNPALLTITGCLAGVIAVEGYQFAQGSWAAASEPLSLTLFPPAAALDLEGYSVNPVTASRLDRAADQARRAYAPATVQKKNLVVIVVDALRPDHMTLYGYGRNTTPKLDRITSEHPASIISGVRATCGDTICALFSLFTSKFTGEFSFRPFTLHEALRRNGYRIHMLLSGDHTYFHTLKSIYGQVNTFYDGTQAHGYYINDDQLLVDRVATMPDWDGKPVMFQFHLMSSHILRKPDEIPGEFQPAKRYALRNSAENGSGGEPLQTAVNFYDNGVLRSDSIIDALLTKLQSKGYLHDTLVVITADHGESLGEHGLFTHANSVREEVLRVPLVVISYGYQPQTRGPARAASSQVDIAPTLLTDLGLPIPATWIGQSLQAPGSRPFSFFEEHAFAGMIDQRDPDHVWKYWIDRRSGVDHVFDLIADPHENLDLRAAVPSGLLTELRSQTRTATSAGLPVH
jgi:glucan phosphoethanolaminetransferase (alkaline phosphatase superfamily)